eukprot:TRINITY_DN68392_c0_g1_i1.p1 TRINITY_DN68392_c0_g1~~TRINITY_DN68392_c0_g1_i1.p1  ORF type:complete len:836 (+),score=171.23 TRINITY_DN68392_c0_g1_i1:115-2622(+)
MTKEDKNAEKSSVYVAVRVRRPAVATEDVAVQVHNAKQITVNSTDEDEPAKNFAFDSVFDSEATQEDVYETLGRRVLTHALEGYNGCLFAYGQTGSGKTHTLLGTDKDPGIIPRFCQDLFSSLEHRRAQVGPDSQFLTNVEVEYMEIYGEKVRDLLEPSQGDLEGPREHKDLKVREHPKRGPYVEGLMRVTARSAAEVQRLMAQGNLERTTAATLMNAVSSRSHAVFRITLHINHLQNDGSGAQRVVAATMSTINLIDLAGSERVKQSGVEGKQLKEAAAINSSLSALGRVISELAEGKGEHVPYRNSKLTWLLRESLGGNSKTVMVATVNPLSDYFNETISTLRYASKCKKIVNRAIINEDPNAKKIRELQEEIAALREALSRLASQGIDGKQVMAIEKALQLNHQMVDRLHGMWEGKTKNDNRQEEIDALELRLRQMEDGGVDLNDPEYLRLQRLAADLREEGSNDNRQLSEKEKVLKELERERQAVVEKNQELENIREEYVRHKESAQAELDAAADEVQLLKYRENNMKAVAEQREAVLAKVIKQNDITKTTLRRELEQLTEELAAVTAQRDELAAIKRRREVRDKFGQNRISDEAAFRIANSINTPRIPPAQRADKRTNTPPRPQPSVPYNLPANPVALEELVRSSLDRLGPTPRPGTKAHEWETRALQRLRERAKELERAHTAEKAKERELEDLRQNIRQQINLRRSGRDTARSDFSAFETSRSEAGPSSSGVMPPSPSASAQPYSTRSTAQPDGRLSGSSQFRSSTTGHSMQGSSSLRSTTSQPVPSVVNHPAMQRLAASQRPPEPTPARKRSRSLFAFFKRKSKFNSV